MALLSLSESPKMVRVNWRLTNRPLRPDSGMGAHHRVESREQLVPPGAVPFVTAPLGHVGREPRIVVDRDQLLAHGAHRRRQPVVGILQARPHGVAPHLGRLEHVEDGAHGRRLQECDVGVPPTRTVHLAVDGEDLGALVDGGQHRVRLGDGAELAGEVGLLLGGQGLLPEEDDVMGVQRFTDGVHDLGGERLGDVHTPDLCPDGGGDRLDADGGGKGHVAIVPEAGTGADRPADRPPDLPATGRPAEG